MPEHPDYDDVDRYTASRIAEQVDNPDERAVTSDMGPFAIVPLWLDKAVSPQAVRVFIWLHGRYCDRVTLEAWPSHQTLAKDLDVSADTIKRAVVELKKAGAITITARHRADGSPTSNLYHVHTCAPLSPHPRSTLGASVRGGGRKKQPLTRSTDPDPVSTVRTSAVALTKPKTDHVRCMKRWHDCHVTLYGRAPVMNGRHGKAMKTLLASQSVDHVLAAISAYFLTADEFILDKHHDFGLFVSQVNRWLTADTIITSARSPQERKLASEADVFEARIRRKEVQ